jgi:UDP-N-acetylglucosamine 2-epimerase (non-hydrolysing)
MTTKICIILGTRPEIIKMSPIIREAKKRNSDFFILHTGQHYSYEMDKLFFQELELPKAIYNLDVGSTTQGEQTAKMLIGIEKILTQEKPDIILVEGDTNTVLAGALTAAKLQIKIGHVEAGLRSYDRTMPEEINRILTDHCSDYLFAPTEKAREILLSENIPDNKIFVTGNTIVDAVMQNLEISNHTDILNNWGLKKKEFFLLTAHRQENVDKQERLAGILKGLGLICENFNLPVVCPIHPRTKKMIERFNLDVPIGINLIDPVGFLEFLQLESNAKLVLTDSGGVQEETCILGVPCLTLRDNTERPETVEVGANKLIGTNPTKIVAGAEEFLAKGNSWKNPFGDGNTRQRILDMIEN